MTQRLWHHGEQYTGERLDPEGCPDDPLALFRSWFAVAEEANLPKVNAMTLATVGADGRPSARIVLLKEVDRVGFVFFTNYESRKGLDLATHPYAAMVFFWDALDRQVRVEGVVERVSAEESDAYFQVRPLASRIGAIASPQSRPLASRAELEARFDEVQAALAEEPPGRPASWGGYRLIPDRLEFWQGQPSRLHDRVEYQRDPVTDLWSRVRLAP